MNRKTKTKGWALPLACVGAVAIMAAAVSAQQGKGKGPKKPAVVKFRVQELHVDNNEGCAVGDIDKDGNLDVTAGEFWYAGPDFSKGRPVRKLLPMGADYLENNGEHLFDVNADGWLDVVSGSFQSPKIAWYENPGGDALNNGKRWKAHELAEFGHEQNEVTMMHDLDGDGAGEVVINSWNNNNPLLALKIEPGADPGVVTMSIGEAGEGTNGHGMGFGDINGDGHEDVMFMNGWYERPATGAADTGWELHADFEFPHASCPMLVLDLNEDGRNDIIWGDGHNYGLYWMEQREPGPDGTTNWRMHTIDKKFSQPHALAWDDVTGDGKPELITGKRVRAHSGKDPGGAEEPVVMYFEWNADTQTFTKREAHRGKAGIGLQNRVADLNGDGKNDLVLAGKSGTHVLWNEGY